jgi:hypothetical protein
MSIPKADTLIERNNTSTQDNSFAFSTYNGKQQKIHLRQVNCFNPSIFNVIAIIIITYLATGHVTNYLILTPPSRVFVAMLLVAQLVNQFLAFYGIR